MTDTCHRCQQILTLIGELAISPVQDHPDTVADFILTQVSLAPGFRTPSSVLYGAYLKFCAQNNWKPLGRNKFGTALEVRGLSAYRGTAGQRVRRGIALL